MPSGDIYDEVVKSSMLSSIRLKIGEVALLPCATKYPKLCSSIGRTHIILHRDLIACDMEEEGGLIIEGF